MAGLKLMTQGGYVPRVAAHLLQDNEAQRAINTKLYAGDLRGWYKPSAVTPAFECIEFGETLYKMKTNSQDDRWVVWDSVVSAVLNPIVDDSEASSIYYTENAELKKTNSSLAGTTNGTPPDDWLYGGVPEPTMALTATKTGTGTGTTEDRIYVYTFIQEFGGIEEESAPSTASNVVTVKATGETVDLTNFEDATGLSHQNVTKIRIYRSVSGSTPTFLFVDEIPASNAATPGYTYNDSKTATQLGEELQTIIRIPPGELSGIVAHPSGFLAGFHLREVLFSEIGFPQAWPIAYRYTVEADIVNIAVYGQSIVVLTKGYPVVFSGTDPGAMTPEKLTELEPCVSARSVASDANGVLYASPNGICLVGPAGTGLATGNIMLRDNFEKFNPPTIRGAVYNGKYFGFYQQATEYLPNGGLILDRTMQTSPFSTTNVQARAAFTDPETAELYYLWDRTVYKWEGNRLNNFPFEWLSKKFIFSDPINLGAIEIHADFLSAEAAAQWEAYVQSIKDANQALFDTGDPLEGDVNDKPLNHFVMGGSILEPIPQALDDRFIQFTLIVDGNEVYNTVYTESGVYRLPSGYKGTIFEMKISGNVEFRYIKVAETMRELKSL
jgi:hypothetical protein